MNPRQRVAYHKRMRTRAYGRIAKIRASLAWAEDSGLLSIAVEAAALRSIDTNMADVRHHNQALIALRLRSLK